MKFKAKIIEVTKHDDELKIDVEFFDGTNTFIKSYPFVHMVDIDTNFEQTIKNELKRINDLNAGFETIKTKIGKEIVE